MTLKTVIIADDTAFVRDRFAAVLQQAGHRALTIKSAAELLARIRTDVDSIDLVVLDLRLPHARGVELVRSIRKVDGGRIPILVFSGTIASAGEVRELVTLGTVGYINEYSSADHILPALAPHLFPDNFNRRSSSRVTLGVPVSYRIGNTIVSAVTSNVGKGGVAISTINPLDPGTKVRVRFRLPGRREIEADARVAWSDRRGGMGFQFERLDASDQTSIDTFVDEHCFSNRKA